MSSLSDKLQSAPFIRLLVPFITGIVLGDLFRPEFKWLFLCLSICCSLLLPFFITISFKRATVFGLIQVPVFLFLGLFFSIDLRYVPRQLEDKEYFAVIVEYPLEKEKSNRAIIRLLEPKIKILAYFEKKEAPLLVEPGSVVWFKGKPELLQKTGNPFEFDYQAYAIRNQIGHRIFLKNSAYHFLNVKPIPNLQEESLIIRDRLLNILEKCGLKGEVLHLVSAVSLGAREELEAETTQSFSKTGVTHVLAVSGMNVAIIFVVLELFLRFLNRKKWGILLQTAIIIVAVWGYALITGLSASVLRAAAMFTFIVVGKSLERNANIYNTLAASAFVLLCYTPSLVYDVGFQLSYAAVFSIVYFHPFIYGLVYCKYWVIDQIWIMLTVSMAAQIGTIPFLLHYFHQFPTWFLLANLMVIPLVTVILYLSFIVFAVAPIIPFLGILMTKVLDWAGQGMLFSVHFVERLPYSVIEGLYPSDLLLFLFVLFAILFTAFLFYKNRYLLTASLITLIFFFIIKDISTYARLNQQEVIVFNLPGKSLIALTSGCETIWLTSGQGNIAKTLKPYIKPYEGYRGISKSSIICLTDSICIKKPQFACMANFINFKGFTFSILNDRKVKPYKPEVYPQYDLIILAGRNQPKFDKNFQSDLSSFLIDCRSYSPSHEPDISNPVRTEAPKNFNTTVGGAVQIKLCKTAEGYRAKSYGYFTSD